MAIGVEPLHWQSKSDGKRCVCFLRHAEAKFNVPNAKRQHDLVRDSSLSREGKKICNDAGRMWAQGLFADADLIVVSPLVRALQTAEGLIGACMRNKTSSILVTPFCTEFIEKNISHFSFGTPKSKLLQRFPWLDGCQGIDTITEHWWPTEVEMETDRQARARCFLEALFNRPEQNIIVVSHKYFLKCILGIDLENLAYHMVELEELKGVVLTDTCVVKQPFEATGMHCIVKKHDSMGCAVVSIESESLREVVLTHLTLGNASGVNLDLRLEIEGHQVQVKPHFDKNTKREVLTDVFIAWGRTAEKSSPLEPAVIAETFDELCVKAQILLATAGDYLPNFRAQSALNISEEQSCERAATSRKEKPGWPVDRDVEVTDVEVTEVASLANTKGLRQTFHESHGVDYVWKPKGKGKGKSKSRSKGKNKDAMKGRGRGQKDLTPYSSCQSL